MSVASGIEPYRAGKGAVWSRFVTQWGTRKKFQENPALWWNHFWLKTHEKHNYYTAVPNMGHYTVARLSQCCNVNVITQNVDALHLASGVPVDQLIEVHGRLGLYKCITPKCTYSYEKSVEDLDIRAYAIRGTLEEDNLEIKPPQCPQCRGPLLPQSLLFDENYNSHTFYNWDTALAWMENADAIVFIGTSFSVGVTQEALWACQELNKPMYSFNIHESGIAGMGDIIGPAEELLAHLETIMMRQIVRITGRPQLWYGNSVKKLAKSNTTPWVINSVVSV